MTVTRIAALCSILALTACASVSRSGMDDLLATDRAFSDFSKTNGAHAAWDKYLVDDAVNMPAGADFIFDKATTLKGFEGIPDTTSLTWTPIGGDIAGSGDIGYTYGRYVVRSKSATGASRESRGKYVTIWKRQPDGTWRVVFDGGNSSPAK